MANNVINLADHQPAVTEHYFGGYPQCGDTDGYLNLGRDHWFFCAKHRTKWCCGSNLFSGWRDETVEDWIENQRRLADYAEVEAVYPPPDRGCS